MSLIFFDGFDQYEMSSGGDYQKGPWSGGNTNSTLSTSNPRHVGYSSFNIANDSSASIFKNFKSQSSTTLVVGHAHYWQSSSYFGQGFNVGLLNVADDAITPVNMVRLYTISTSQALRITDSDDILYYSVNTLSATEWYYIELRLISGPAGVGVCEVYVNNVKWEFDTVGNGTGTPMDTNVVTNGGTGNYGQIQIGDRGTYIDDVYVDNATRHGDVRVIPLVPETDAAVQGWVKGGTPSPSDCTDQNKCYVNKLGADSDPIDQNYVRINGIASDVYNMTDLPPGTWDVKGVTLASRCLKESSGSPTMTLSSDAQDGSVATAAGLITYDAITQVDAVFDDANGTSGGWTSQQVNDMVLTMSYD